MLATNPLTDLLDKRPNLHLQHLRLPNIQGLQFQLVTVANMREILTARQRSSDSRDEEYCKSKSMDWDRQVWRMVNILELVKGDRETPRLYQKLQPKIKFLVVLYYAIVWADHYLNRHIPPKSPPTNLQASFGWRSVKPLNSFRATKQVKIQHCHDFGLCRLKHPITVKHHIVLNIYWYHFKLDSRLLTSTIQNAARTTSILRLDLGKSINVAMNGLNEADVNPSFTQCGRLVSSSICNNWHISKRIQASYLSFTSESCDGMVQMHEEHCRNLESKATSSRLNVLENFKKQCTTKKKEPWAEGVKMK